jgi:hypothetical protein
VAMFLGEFNAWSEHDDHNHPPLSDGDTESGVPSDCKKSMSPPHPYLSDSVSPGPDFEQLIRFTSPHTMSVTTEGTSLQARNPQWLIPDFEQVTRVPYPHLISVTTEGTSLPVRNQHWLIPDLDQLCAFNNELVHPATELPLFIPFNDVRRVVKGIYPSWLMPASAQMVSLHEDASLVHLPSQLVPPSSSQSQFSQLEPDVPTDPPFQCPCPFCEKDFNRPQERNRHIRTYLPASYFCPIERCPWRGDRHHNLKAHWRTKHANFNEAPQPEDCKIYDPDPLIQSIVNGRMPMEEATLIALTEVERRAAVLDKVGIWTDGNIDRGADMNTE